LETFVAPREEVVGVEEVEEVCRVAPSVLGRLVEEVEVELPEGVEEVRRDEEVTVRGAAAGVGFAAPPRPKTGGDETAGEEVEEVFGV